MISDILSDASVQITDYLRTMPNIYPPDSRITARILAVQNTMDELRRTLDCMPTQEGKLP